MCGEPPGLAGQGARLMYASGRSMTRTCGERVFRRTRSMTFLPHSGEGRPELCGPSLLHLSPSGLPPGTFRAPCGRAWASGPGSCAPDGSSAFRSRPRRIPKRRTTGTDPEYVWRGSWQHTPAVVPLRFFRAFPRRGNRSTRTPCPTPVPCSRGLS